MPIRLMLFDLWGTLIVDDPVAAEKRRLHRARTAAHALRELGHEYDVAQVEAAFVAAGDAHGRIHSEGLDLSADGRTVFYVRHLDATLPSRLDDAGWQRMHEVILTPALTFPPTVMPGAKQALLDVKSLGLPVGLISNAGLTPGFVLRQFLDDFDLLPHFDDTIFSDEVELAKPAAAIFERALDTFGIAPDEAAFVGDQPVLDVLGPRSAGIWSIQLGDLAEDGISPHARISTLDELIPALRTLRLLD